MPLHPLAVHLPVVIIPLTALGLLAWVLVPSIGAKVRSWLVGGGLLGVIGAAWSKTTGVELLKDIGRSPQSPGDVAPHMMWGISSGPGLRTHPFSQKRSMSTK